MNTDRGRWPNTPRSLAWSVCMDGRVEPGHDGRRLNDPADRSPAHTTRVDSRRALSLADLSWPQAAAMSRPRGTRIGAE